jgi:hypothetical protein
MMCWQKYTPFEIQYIITNHSGYKINQYRIAYNYFICISVRCKFVGRFPSASFEGSLTFRRWTCLHISWMQGKLMYISTTIDRLHFGSVAIVCFFFHFFTLTVCHADNGIWSNVHIFPLDFIITWYKKYNNTK